MLKNLLKRFCFFLIIKGEIIIELSEVLIDEDTYLKFSITDTGPGIESKE
jgi:hypothetical protein